MKRILTLGAALAAMAVGASSAFAAATPVPFPAAKAGPVFIAAQTVTTGGVMTNYFAPGNTVVFRAYAVDAKTKQIVDAKDVKYFYVMIPNQPFVKLTYQPNAAGATKDMPWVGTWTVPSYVTPGNVPIDIRIKLKSDLTGQFVQMPVATAMLTVSAKPPATYTPAPTGSVGLVSSTGKTDLSLYVDSVNGSRPVGAAPRQIGCTQTNVYKRGEQAVFRTWGMDLASGDVLSIDNVKDAHIVIPGQPNLTLNWGAHGSTGSQVYFWTSPWNIPATFPLGSTTAQIVFTTVDGKTATFDYSFTVIP